MNYINPVMQSALSLHLPVKKYRADCQYKIRWTVHVTASTLLGAHQAAQIEVARMNPGCKRSDVKVLKCVEVPSV